MKTCQMSTPSLKHASFCRCLLTCPQCLSRVRCGQTACSRHPAHKGLLTHFTLCAAQVLVDLPTVSATSEEWADGLLETFRMQEFTARREVEAEHRAREARRAETRKAALVSTVCVFLNYRWTADAL